MNTIRVRRSPSGHAARWRGRCTTCWTPSRTTGPRLADVEQALHAEHVEAAAVQQHRQPHGEGVPVERLVEDGREGGGGGGGGGRGGRAWASWGGAAGPGSPSTARGPPARPASRSAGAIAPNETRRTAASG